MRLAQLLESELPRLREGELAPVEVAVLDTGIDATHPALEGRVSEAFRVELGERGYRANACVVPDNNDPFGHGTGVASLITEVAPNARIVDIRIVASDDVQTGEALLTGLRLALLRRLPVLNLSLACHGRFLAPMTQLCEKAYWQNQLVIAARRNMPLQDYGLPALLSSCIGVESDELPSPFDFRFREKHPVELAARGEQVTVAAPGGKYTVQTGSSYATAVVTGLCCILLGAFPGLSPFEIKSALKAFASEK